jgi:hypothetical protein
VEKDWDTPERRWLRISTEVAKDSRTGESSSALARDQRPDSGRELLRSSLFCQAQVSSTFIPFLSLIFLILIPYQNGKPAISSNG